MMEQHRGYWIHGSAVPGPPNTTYWEGQGTVLKPGRAGSVVEVVRLCDREFTFDLKELAEWYGLELSRIAVDACLTQGDGLAT